MKIFPLIQNDELFILTDNLKNIPLGAEIFLELHLNGEVIRNVNIGKFIYQYETRPQGAIASFGYISELEDDLYEIVIKTKAEEISKVKLPVLYNTRRRLSGIFQTTGDILQKGLDNMEQTLAGMAIGDMKIVLSVITTISYIEQFAANKDDEKMQEAFQVLKQLLVLWNE